MECPSDRQRTSKEPKRILMSYSYPEGVLPLPDPFPDYLICPHCGEREVEVWCYEQRAQCHRCGGWIEHKAEITCRIHSFCQGGDLNEEETSI